jgi:ribonuclease D
MHRARGRRALAAVRELWEARDAIAAQRDVTPGRIIPDSAIVEAANALPRDRSTLLALKGFKGRGAQRYAGRWVEALNAARDLPEDELPPLAARYDGPPPPRAWADRDPVAAARLTSARSDLAGLAKDLNLPVENLLTPDFVRRLLWEPPEVMEHELSDAVVERLRDYGARQWQVELSVDVLTRAIVTAPTRVAEQEAAALAEDDES